MGNTPSTTDFNPYEILGVERDADIEEIKLAYKLKAKQLHPDRNRGKPDYEKKREKFKLVQVAFEILSSDEHRRQYDNEFGSTHAQMKESSRKALEQKQELAKAEKDRFVPKGQFDNDAFNKAFQERRFADPNDRGYGEEMAPRLKPEDVKGGRRNDHLDEPEMIFSSREAFNSKDFNKIFEYRKEQYQKKNPIIAQEDIEPAGFSLGGQTPYTDIAVYEGAMILGKETQDFGNVGSMDNLIFSDYKQSFGQSASNPGNISKSTMDEIRGRKYQGDISAMTDSEFNQRLNEKQMAYRQPLTPQVPKGQRKASFAMAEQMYIKKKEEQIRKEREEQKKIVMKYKDQYPQHLLEDLGIHDNDQNATTTDVSADPRTNRSINDLMRERNAMDHSHGQFRRRRMPMDNIKRPAF